LVKKIKSVSKDLNQKIYFAGHRGMVDSAIVRTLQAQGCTTIITRTHAELELTNQPCIILLQNTATTLEFIA